MKKIASPLAARLPGLFLRGIALLLVQEDRTALFEAVRRLFGATYNLIPPSAIDTYATLRAFRAAPYFGAPQVTYTSPGVSGITATTGAA